MIMYRVLETENNKLFQPNLINQTLEGQQLGEYIKINDILFLATELKEITFTAMNTKEIGQLARDYFFEQYFFDSMEEYLAHHNIILELSDMKKFKFYVKIETNKNNRQKRESELKKILENCIAFKSVYKTDNTKFIIFHPCTRQNYKYQLSFFDSYGAIMDEKSKTIEDIIENYLHYYNDYEIKEVMKNAI